MKRPPLDEWIAEMRASGHWISSCPSCGYFFAQNRHLRGRRATSCDWHRCVLWQRWRRHYGRAPPASMMERWRKLYGDEPALAYSKRHALPRTEAAA